MSIKGVCMKLPMLFAGMIGCAVLHSSSYAHCCWTKYNPGFYDLRVELKNLGVENCVLEKYEIRQGELYGSNVPNILSSNGQAFYLTLSGHTIDITIDYQCGTNKKISLSMQQYVKENYKHTSIDALATNAVDVFEKHTVHPSEVGCCSSHDKFSVVTWELTN